MNLQKSDNFKCLYKKSLETYWIHHVNTFESNLIRQVKSINYRNVNGIQQQIMSKAPFSIATSPKCRGGCYSIPGIAPLYPWSLPYNAECLARQHHVPFFESLVSLDLGFNPSLPDHWRTLYSLGQWPANKCKKSKLATLVKGDPKAPFSIATTPRCRGGCYTIPWISPLYPWSLPYSAEC